MGNPIENALAKYKKDYKWDKNLIADTEEELKVIECAQFVLVSGKKEPIKL